MSPPYAANVPHAGRLLKPHRKTKNDSRDFIVIKLKAYLVIYNKTDYKSAKHDKINNIIYISYDYYKFF